MTEKKKYIIALGASAGGIAALSEFFDNTLPDGVSYVITTHLHPHQKSWLVEIIQRHSLLEVCEAGDYLPVKTNVVYIMPENKVMSIHNGELMLKPRDLSLKVNKAIDIFFLSLAEDTQFEKIAIILSGMGDDGSKGVKAISDKGGYIIAQAPVSADESSMPRAAISAGFVDLILEPKQMPEAIIKYIQEKSLM